MMAAWPSPALVFSMLVLVVPVKDPPTVTGSPSAARAGAGRPRAEAAEGTRPPPPAARRGRAAGMRAASASRLDELPTEATDAASADVPPGRSRRRTAKRATWTCCTPTSSNTWSGCRADRGGAGDSVHHVRDGHRHDVRSDSPQDGRFARGAVRGRGPDALRLKNPGRRTRGQSQT